VGDALHARVQAVAHILLAMGFCPCLPQADADVHGLISMGSCPCVPRLALERNPRGSTLREAEPCMIAGGS